MSGFDLGSFLNESIQEDLGKDDPNFTRVGDSSELHGAIDDVFDKNNLEKIYDGVCPICGDVSEKLHEAELDPKNMRIIFDEKNDMYYVDFKDFGAYCEASWKTPNEALDAISEAYKNDCDINITNFSVVVPTMETFCNCNCDKVGYINIAWSSNFLMDCVNAGLKCTTFINPGIGPAETITEAANGDFEKKD